jgi:hypothetical protein
MMSADTRYQTQQLTTLVRQLADDVEHLGDQLGVEGAGRLHRPERRADPGGAAGHPDRAGCGQGEAVPDGEVVGQFKTGEQYGAVVNRDSQNLDALNQVIKTLKSEGSIDQLLQKFLSDQVSVPVIGLRGAPAVQQFIDTFLSWDDFKASIPSVLRGFMTNLSLMFVAEACVLIWGLVLALLRSTRSVALLPCAG